MMLHASIFETFITQMRKMNCQGLA